MITVRTVRSADDFAGAPGDPDGFAGRVRALWDEGTSRPEWCFVLERGSERLGRVGYLVEPTVPDPRFLGSLPPTEMFAFGLDLPWEGTAASLAPVLFDESLSAAGAEPAFTHITVHNEVHPHAEVRAAVLETAGCDLFQEKQGFVWRDEGAPIAVPSRLEYRTLEDIGDEAYGSVMGPTQEGTLDRNDQYYWGGTGPEAWAGVFLSIAGDDRSSWLVGFAQGEPVGFIAVSAFDEDATATIAHCGVLPRQRGNGYIVDLLLAGIDRARARGFASMVSDVDVLNTPMMAAMRRTGHRDDARPWHKWVFRRHRPGSPGG